MVGEFEKKFSIFLCQFDASLEVYGSAISKSNLMGLHRTPDDDFLRINWSFSENVIENGSSLNELNTLFIIAKRYFIHKLITQFLKMAMRILFFYSMVNDHVGITLITKVLVLALLHREQAPLV